MEIVDISLGHVSSGSLVTRQLIQLYVAPVIYYYYYYALIYKILLDFIFYFLETFDSFHKHRSHTDSKKKL